MSLSNFSENALLNWLFTAESMPTRPDEWYVAIHDGDPGEDGTSDELVAGDDANFVRKSVTFGVSTVGQSPSLGAVSWDPTAGTHVVTHISIWDAITGGNCLTTGALVVPRTVTNGNPLAIVAGDILNTLD